MDMSRVQPSKNVEDRRKPPAPDPTTVGLDGMINRFIESLNHKDTKPAPSPDPHKPNSK